LETKHHAIPQEFEMRTLDTARFQDAEKYASYLRSAAGKLRCELAWENLRAFLPSHGSRPRILDLGGGTGLLSVRLAGMEFEVVLLDSSEEMLVFARRDAEASGVAARISFCHADAAHLHDLFKAQSFDFVVCHNLLEYVADPGAIIHGIAHVARKNGAMSILVRNRAGEVLKAAIKSSDWGLAKANISAETVVDSLYGKPVRVFNPAEVLDMLAGAGLGVVAEYGVRVFSDYLESEDLDGDASRQLLELELILGAHPQFAAIARYSQFIARRSGAVPAEGT
jgi:S-adenosylmethionine-dependent methyltransferase